MDGRGPGFESALDMLRDVQAQNERAKVTGDYSFVHDGKRATAFFATAQWKPDNDGFVILVADGGQVLYDIELACCKTSAQALDWIMQVSKKTWADDRILAQLVRVLDYVLDPQARMCSMGVEQNPGGGRGG